jgi:exodeoxyribonuclease-5
LFKIEFDEKQKEAISFIKERIKNNERETVCAGYAGTGKSVVLSHIANEYPNFAIGAYTGKAACVLKDKGIHRASTIHSLIFRPMENEDGEVRFVQKTVSEVQKEYEGFLIDEGSMVPAEIYKPLLKYKLPIVFFGDHGQLEPVGTNIDLMKNPHFVLEKIHRNAGEIAHFAEWIRKGENPIKFKSSGNVVVLNEIKDVYLTQVDQNICAFNKFRVDTNRRIRKILGRKDETPEAGDRIMCLRNNWDLGLYNGMQGIVKSVNLKKKKIKFQVDNQIFEVKYCPDQFNQEKTLDDISREIGLFDYAYTCTCHKTQGSEYPTVLVFEQKCKHWSHVKWSYTAASRAKENLIWILPRFY